VIDVARDRDGVREALDMLLEEDFARAVLDRRAPNADDDQRVRMEGALPVRVLSPGYFRWAEHLLRLDAEREAGVPLRADDLAAYEVDGLLDIQRVRAEFQRRHPVCGACGERQDNRHQARCNDCGVKFERK
jgi:hypothetical protein